MKTMMLLSRNYEESEALVVVDYLRRAEIDVDMVATEGALETVGAHNITILADKLLEEIQPEDYDVVMTPGGLGGTQLLSENETVITLLKRYYQEGKYIASICASPMVLGVAGISQHIRGTIFPGLEDRLTFKTLVEDQLVVNDTEHHVITSRGPATAPYFALAIIEQLKGKAVRDEVAEALLLPLVETTIKGI